MAPDHDPSRAGTGDKLMGRPALRQKVKLADGTIVGGGATGKAKLNKLEKLIIADLAEREGGLVTIAELWKRSLEIGMNYKRNSVYRTVAKLADPSTYPKFVRPLVYRDSTGDGETLVGLVGGVEVEWEGYEIPRPKGEKLIAQSVLAMDDLLDIERVVRNAVNDIIHREINRLLLELGLPTRWRPDYRSQQDAAENGSGANESDDEG